MPIYGKIFAAHGGGFSRFLSLAPILVFLLFVYSCGPSISKSFVLPKIDPQVSPDATLKNQGADSYVFVDEFIDARPKAAVVNYNGRLIESDSEAVKIIVDGLREGLTVKGFKLSDTAPTILAGELRTWVANVSGGFTKISRAESAVFVEVLDPANKRVYSGVYKGFATIESPGLNEKDIRDTLRTSMNEAVQQVLADEQLIRLLSAF